MSTETVSHLPHESTMRRAGEQFFVLASRAILGLFRQPVLWIPGLIFPLMIAAVNSSSVAKARQGLAILYAPAHPSFLQFLAAGVIFQGVVFGSITAGTSLAGDIQSGFQDRLLVSPIVRFTILMGRLSASMVWAAVQVIFFILVFYPFGARVEGGIAGFLAILLIMMMLSLAMGGFAAGIAARTGDPEAVQSFFPILFAFLFMSSAFFPTQTMTGWYQKVAQHNPLSTVIDGVRHQFILGFGFPEAAKAFGVATLLAIITVTFALSGFRKRWKVAS